MKLTKAERQLVIMLLENCRDGAAEESDSDMARAILIKMGVLSA